MDFSKSILHCFLALAAITGSSYRMHVQAEDECGIIETSATPLILHGNEFIPSKMPWVAVIYQRRGSKVFQRTCGGTLISPLHILTAAYCVRNADNEPYANGRLPKIGLGRQFVAYNDSRDLQTAQYFDVQEVHVPEEYDGETNNFYSDFAVLKLSTNVKINEYVRPVCIDSATGNKRDLTKKIGKMAHWFFRNKTGTSNDGAIFNFQYKSYEECKDYLSIINLKNYQLTKDTFCSYSEDGDKETVPEIGNGGNGLIFEFDKKNYVYGTLSIVMSSKVSTFTDIRGKNAVDFINKILDSKNKQ